MFDQTPPKDKPTAAENLGVTGPYAPVATENGAQTPEAPTVEAIRAPLDSVVQYDAKGMPPYQSVHPLEATPDHPRYDLPAGFSGAPTPAEQPVASQQPAPEAELPAPQDPQAPVGQQ